MGEEDSASLDYQTYIAKQDVATAILVPYLVGLIAQVLLIGVFLTLFTSYVQTDFKHHSRKVRAVMWIVFLLTLGCLGMSCEEIIDTGASQERSSEKLFSGPAQSNVLPVLTALTGSVCQGFLMCRAALLINNRTTRYIFGAFTTALILLSLAGATLFSGMGFLIVAGSTATPLKYSTALAIWLFSGAAADLAISIALAWTLNSRIMGFNERTDSLLKRLILVALRTAAYTSIISIAGAAIATAIEYSKPDVHTASAGFAFWLPLPALHAISLYTTLCTRRVVTAQLGGGAGGGVISGKPGAADDREKGYPPARGLSPSARATVRLAGLGAPRKSIPREEDGAEPGMLSFPRSVSGIGGGSSRHLPLQVTVQCEEQVEYDDYTDFDDDLARDARKEKKRAEEPVRFI
ncbi:hypothetical protein JCM8097_009298 [Rhodosporidiobolus ruineniae]